MTEATHRQAIEDHVLMAHAYANSMGAPGALEQVEATISERRIDAATDYASKIRQNVTTLFMQAECRDLGEYVRQARDYESGWWALFDKQCNLEQP